MNRLGELLGETGRQWEPDLRARFAGPLGGIFRVYLPQTWVFRTESESATLRVDGDGRVTVTDGDSAPADVTIEVPFDRLATALRTRAKGAVPAAELRVTTSSAKGRAAFDYLRGRLGL